MKYRSDIDGLRAIAVLSVIFYHAGYSWASGGLLGVDVFFVISGYLITTTLLNDIDQGRLSAIRFYIKRARRLLPALVVVIAICTPLAWMILLPKEHDYYSLSMMSTLIFISNIYHEHYVNYFAPWADRMPLLHTWSLSVEEQFYLIFPVALLGLCHCLSRRYVMLVVTSIVVGSLLFGHWYFHDSPESTFYNAASRAWELLAGALLATYTSRRDIKPNFALTLIGSIILTVSLLTYSPSSDSMLYYTLLCVSGTVMMIAFTKHDDPMNRILRAKVLVLIGLISYSAYLWHQPVLAFLRVYKNDNVTGIETILAIITCLLLAYLTWRYVEKPFRKTPHEIKQSRSFIVTIVGINLILVSYGAYSVVGDGNLSRYKISQDVFDTIQTNELRASCFEIKESHITEQWSCSMGQKKSKPDAFILGDSHGMSLLPAFEYMANKEGLSVEFAGNPGCIPLLETYVHRNKKDQSIACHALNQRVYEYIINRDIDNLILVGAWSQYTTGGYSKKRVRYLSQSLPVYQSIDSSRKSFDHGLAITIEKYEKQGVNLIFISQVPEQPDHIIRLYDQANRSEDVTLADVSASSDQHHALQRYPMESLITQEQQVVDLTSEMCVESVCLLGTDTETYYNDKDHLSPSGALRLKESVSSAIGRLIK